MEVVKVYTDGACSRNGKEGSRASFACWFPNHKELSKSGRVPDDQPQTNNRGELLAILEAVKIVNEKFNPDNIELEIYTDSQYSKNCLTVWLPGWIANGWKTSQNTPVQNKDLIEETTKLLRKFKYTISYVEAHAGITDNEIVDKMAVAVLNPEVVNIKIVHTNVQKPIEGLPIELMGPPVSENTLVDWCKENLNKLDETLLNNALLNVLTKTLKANGFDLHKQKLHRGHVYRLNANNLITEPIKIIKEE